MAVIDAARRAAESLMDLMLTAYSPEGHAVVDGLKVPTFTPEGATRGKVQARTSGPGGGNDTGHRTVRVGGVERPVLQGGLHIPVSAPVPTAGDRGVGWEYVVTSVGPTSDPALLGRRFLVVGAPTKSLPSARRLDVCEVPAP